jgi:hypothetical protein
MNAQRKQFIVDLIDTAGYGIGYWAASAEVDTEEETYLITEQEGGEFDWPVRLHYADIWDAVVRVAKDGNLAAQEAVADLDDCDIDSVVADIIIQTAIFGKVIYG